MPQGKGTYGSKKGRPRKKRERDWGHNVNLALTRLIKEGDAVPSKDMPPEARKKHERMVKILNMIKKQEAKFLKDKAISLNKKTPMRKFRK